MSVSELADCINWVAIRVLKGLGKIRLLPVFQVVVYYLFHQPVSLVLIHYFSLGF